MRFVVRLLLLAGGFALATAWLGWWAVPIGGLAGGLLLPRSARPLRLVPLAAGLGWAILLARSAAAPGFGPFVRRLEDLLQTPSAVLIGATLLFPVISAGTAVLVAIGLAARPTHPLKE
jgi:hypothetical protein